MSSSEGHTGMRTSPEAHVRALISASGVSALGSETSSDVCDNYLLIIPQQSVCSETGSCLYSEGFSRLLYIFVQHLQLLLYALTNALSDRELRYAAVTETT